MSDALMGATGLSGAALSDEFGRLAAALGGTAEADDRGSGIADDSGYGPQIAFGGDDEPLRSGVTPLLEYGLLKVHGTDAASFLQAQLTNDVAGLAEDEVRLAGYCSVKGRLMASFWVWRDAAEQTFWLACSRNIAATVAKRLSMFVMRAKAKVDNVSDDLALVGLIALGDDPLPGGVRTVLLPPVVIGASLAAEIDSGGLAKPPELSIARGIQVVPAAALQETLEGMSAAGIRLLSTQVWRRLEVLSGIPRINAANQELFVPQMVNFELVQGVSFTKGCYPGQEVVARSQYLGKLKRRMFLGLGQGPVPLPGTDVSAGVESVEPVGQVVLAASLGSDNRFVALFESRTAAVPEEGAGLRTGSSPLSRLPLPYVLPPLGGSPLSGPGAA